MHDFYNNFLILLTGNCKIFMNEINDILVVLNKLARRNYFIPSYQRGFRWEKQQITELLDDILDFSENRDDQDYYCLQPVVVRKLSADEKILYNLENNDEQWYEVIDGQQRITTLTLIIHYFNEQFIGKNKIPEPKIRYETRETCIDEIFIDERTDKARCETKDNLSNIDLYHIINSYQYIHNWFSEEREVELDSNKIMSVFRTMVKVIWYEVNDTINDGSSAIELFTRINMGKIPLTNAELIKALFLRKRNFDSNKELRQIEIAKEWDSMEYALQNDDFWLFLNKHIDNKPARIEYIFDMMYNKERNKAKELGKLEKFDRLYGIDDYRTFRYFANRFKNTLNNSVSDCWKDVLNCFSALKEWFEDPIYYHYIGYLIICGVSIVDIFAMYDNSPKDKFIKQLKNAISEIVKDVHYSLDNGTISFNLSYVNDKDSIRKLLLLFNIQYMIIHNSKSEHWYIRFPFDLYKKQKWDIEHINSFTTYEITKGEEQLLWISTAIEDLKNIGIDIEVKDEDLYEDILKFADNTVNNLFPGIKARIAKHAGEDVNEDEDIKNNIGNLTLLNADINRGYGNSLFVTKRKEIINKDKEGCFIPICTKNIFLKYYDTEGSSKTIWSKANGDHAKYLIEIKETLDEFITIDAE